MHPELQWAERQMTHTRNATLAATLAIVLCSPQKAAPQEAPVGNAFQARIDATIYQTTFALLEMPFPNAPRSDGGPWVPLGPFSSWSEKDRSLVPSEVISSCEKLWVTQRSISPSTKLLPEAEDQTDENGIGTDICVATHMPSDWPRTREYNIQARDIFKRAKKLGSLLTLPPGFPDIP
jgi:hypothetical protein